MNNFTAFSQGFNEKRDDNRRKRRELAEAWQTYKAANPHATYDEMQEYIDGMTGGSNYLRGGMPSGELLQTIADGNAKAKSAAEQRQRLADMSEKVRVRDLMEGNAKRYLRQSNGDVVAAAEAFKKDYGGDLAGLDMAGFFTPEAWDAEVQAMTAENYDRAKQFIWDSEGKVPSSLVAQRFGVPEDVAQAIILRAEKEAEANEQNRLDAQNEKLWGRRQDAITWLVDQAEDGRDGREMLGGFFGVDPSEIDDNFLGGILEQAEVKRQEIQKQKDLEWNTTMSGHKKELRSAMTNDAMLLQAIKAGNLEVARRTMNDMVSDLPPEVADSLGEGWIDTILNQQIAVLQEAQDAERQTRIDQYGKMAIEAGESVDADSLAIGTEYQKFFDDPSKAAAVLAVSRKYALDETHLPVLQQALNGVEGTPSDMVALANNALAEVGAYSISEARQMKRDEIFRQAGGQEEDMTFERWQELANEDLQDLRVGMGTTFDEAWKEPEPEKRLHLLKVARSKAQRQAQVITQGIRADAKNARNLITVGTAPWDNEAAEKQIERTELIVKAHVTKLNGLIADIEKELAAAPPVTQEPAYRRETPWLKEEPSAWQKGLGLDHVQNRTAFGNEMDRLQLEAGADNGWFGAFTQSNTDYLDRRLDDAFLADEGVQGHFLENPELLREFANAKDKRKYLESSEHDFVKAFLKNYRSKY